MPSATQRNKTLHKWRKLFFLQAGNYETENATLGKHQEACNGVHTVKVQSQEKLSPQAKNLKH